MPTHDTDLADRSGNLFESHKGYDPRIRLFYFVTAALLLILAGGLSYQQLFKTDVHHERERQQNQRRILIPGPRGNIYDRHGQVLVRNRPRLAVVLYLDELRSAFLAEFRRIRTNYRETGDKDLPSSAQMSTLARISVVQSYLDQVNAILGRELTVDSAQLKKHFASELLLPYPLIDDLEPADYARLIERLPVRSPLQLYTSNTREYPFGSAAAHTLGYVGTTDSVETDDFPGEDLKTFKMRGTVGRTGLERRFDGTLQGEAGGKIFRVDPAGYKLVDREADVKILPKQGKNLTTSLDIDLQLAAEQAIGDQIGSAVALDVRTGEVLVLARKPDYNLNDTSPHLSTAVYQDINQRDALTNYTIWGAYPPGSTFKILTSIAALRSGKVLPDQPITNCDGVVKIGNILYKCYNGKGHHGDVLLPDAIAHSCDIFFYEAGRLLTPDVLAAEARRFHLDQPTGIELPLESHRMVIPDPAYKLREFGENWFSGDTANTSIGQGFVLVTPLEMACFIASVARDEVFTKPTLLHDANAPTQHTESIGLTSEQRAALIAGMEGTVTYGTAKSIFSLPLYKIPGIRIAGKTGTAQVRVNKNGKVGTINLAWFICFAPVEKPEIAIAVMLEGETIGEEFGGGREAGPVAAAILKKYFEKQANPAAVIQAFKPAGN